MNSDSAWNMFVFRDGRRTAAGATLARALADALRALDAPAAAPAQPDMLEALLLAGEFECALADAASPDAAVAAYITDALADAAVSPGTVLLNVPTLLDRIPRHPPAQISISPPEGFAYYALHPLDFSDLAAQVTLSSSTIGVIGIRSIGATLSALVVAALRRRGLRAERFTVRPTGHPYDRQTRFTASQQQRIAQLVADGAEFLVADEGPGMSGSSFLSVGDALNESGVPRDRIAFLGSRNPDPDALRAQGAGGRWRLYRSYCAQKNSRLPLEASIYVGGGDWRQHLIGGPEQWPASWTQMERLKFLSSDRRLLFKFEGFGRFGRAVYERFCRIADAGFGPRPLDFTQGFVVYPQLSGAPATPAHLTSAVLDRIAAYCAFRASEFRSTDVHSAGEIETMVRFNLAEEFGCELPFIDGTLHPERPVLADGRMLPHEWIATSSGELMKVDAASHCDDHFFPGPSVDIAWDIAGAIVEWNMGQDATRHFLARYRQLSGDDPGPRLDSFLLAYSVFRFGYCKMAAGAVAGSGEEHRLLAAHQRYRSVADALMARRTAAVSTAQLPEQPLAA